MSHPEQINELVQKFLDKSDFTEEHQALLNQLLSTKEGRKQWVEELQFQANLVDVLQTEKASIKTDHNNISEINSYQRKAEPNKIPVTLRFSGWVALAALLMIAFFMSYYINGMPQKADHTVLGKIVDVTGEVHLNRGPLNVLLQKGMSFKEGDKLLTSTKGSVIFKYKDGSKLALGTDSRLAFSTKSQKDQDNWDVGLDKGKLDADIQPQLQSLKLKTAHLGVTVLGTQFSMKSLNNQEEVHLHQGKLNVQSNASKIESYQLNSLQFISSKADNSSVNQGNLAPPTWEEVEIIALHEKENTVLVNREGELLLLQLPEENSTKKHEISSLHLISKLKVGQKIKTKLQGLACPQMIDLKLPNHL